MEPKLAWCGGRTPYFHPWVDKVAQVVPNRTQSASKGAKMKPKCCPGCSKCGPKGVLKGGFVLRVAARRSVAFRVQRIAA